jgi:hypothetical protein
MTGRGTAAYELTDAETASLLELARLAAHERGERPNAPLFTTSIRCRPPERVAGEKACAPGVRSTLSPGTT